jgi:hypothetical protein
MAHQSKYDGLIDLLVDNLIQELEEIAHRLPHRPSDGQIYTDSDTQSTWSWDVTAGAWVEL